MTRVTGAPLWTLRAPVTAGYGLAVTCLITWLWSCDDRDTNEETAPPLYQRSELGFEWCAQQRRNTYLAWGHHHSLRRPIFIKWETVFCKPIKHLFTLRTTRWIWSAR